MAKKYSRYQLTAVMPKCSSTTAVMSSPDFAGQNETAQAAVAKKVIGKAMMAMMIKGIKPPMPA